MRAIGIFLGPAASKPQAVLARVLVVAVESPRQAGVPRFLPGVANQHRVAVPRFRRPVDTVQKAFECQLIFLSRKGGVEKPRSREPRHQIQAVLEELATPSVGDHRRGDLASAGKEFRRMELLVGVDAVGLSELPAKTTDASEGPLSGVRRDGQGREDANRLVAGVVNLDQVHGPNAPCLVHAGPDELHHRLVHRLALACRKS
jgi:hypothetical protein